MGSETAAMKAVILLLFLSRNCWQAASKMQSSQFRMKILYKRMLREFTILLPRFNSTENKRAVGAIINSNGIYMIKYINVRILTWEKIILTLQLLTRNCCPLTWLGHRPHMVFVWSEIAYASGFTFGLRNEYILWYFTS